MPTFAPPQARRNTALGGLVLAAGLAIIRFGLPLEVDEGLTLTAGWQVSQGLVPYRDFFDFLAPGSFYLVGGLIAAFGPSYPMIRLVSVLLGLLTMVAVDRLTVRLGGRGWLRFAVVALWVALQANFPAINHNHFAELASIWAAYLLVAAWQEDRTGWWLGAGGCAAISVWMHQIRGGAVLVAGVLALLLARRGRALAAYGGAAAGVLLPLLAWPRSLLWSHLVSFPLGNYAAPNFVSLKLLAATAVLFLAVGAAARWWVQPAAGFWPLFALAAALLFSIGTRADVQYLALVLWPLPVLAAAVAAAPWRSACSVRFRRQVQYLGAYASFLVVIQIVGWTAVYAGTALALEQENHRLGRTSFWEAVAGTVRERTNPGEPIFATPYLPAVYFFSQRPNATRYNILLSRHHPTEFFADAVASLERVQPKVVVRALGSFAVGRGFHQDGTVLDQYLDQHYQIAQSEIGGYPVQLLERRAVAP